MMRTLLMAAAAAVAAVVVAQNQSGPPQLHLALVSRDGTVTRLGPAPPGAFAPRISPDGRRLAIDSAEGVWIAPLADFGAKRRFGPDRARYPMWSSDGRQLVFINDADGAEALFWQRADGSAGPQMIARPARAPESWPAAHPLFSFIRRDDRNYQNYSIWTYSVDTTTVTPLIDSGPSEEHSSQFSPDGGTIIYVSNRTGRWEIYAQAFPRVGEAAPITTDGGSHPLWSRDGTELFFNRDGQLFVTSVKAGAQPVFGGPAPLPITGFVQGAGRRQFDVTADGRFLMLVR